MSLFSLALVYGAYAASLQPIMDDLAKEYGKVYLNQTSVVTSNNFLADLKANPKQFVAEVTKLDPIELEKIIGLLDGMKDTSETREEKIVDDLTKRNAEAVITENAKVAAQTAVDNAQKALTNAQQDLASTTAAHAAKLIEQKAAQAVHDDEFIPLNDEQQILTNVIDMLQNLHSKQVLSDYALGVCLPKTPYIANECCPTGYNEMATFDECKLAYGTLRSTILAGTTMVGYPISATPNTMVNGNRPSGCIWLFNNLIFFNTADSIGNGMAGNDKVICIKS